MSSHHRIAPLLTSPLVLALAVLPACTTRLETTPPRTAKEQVMLSYAVRDALDEWHHEDWGDRRVYLDAAHLESIDREFIVGEVRDWVGRQDAIVVDHHHQAELRLEVRSAGVGLERQERLIGVPAFVIPLPGVAPVQTPELAVFKDNRRKGVAALSITGFDTETDRRLFGHGPRIGQTYESTMLVLFVPVHRVRHNLPREVELTRPRERE